MSRPHAPIDVYTGHPACLEDPECHWEDDFKQPGPNGEWCPHVKHQAKICVVCSVMDDVTQSWPEQTSVAWPCAFASQSGEATR